MAMGIISLNHLLNKKLYGRDEVDIFKTYYRANTKASIWRISDGFIIKELRYNFDPAYTSFESVTYFLTKIVS
jgi:hypothetical protein